MISIIKNSSFFIISPVVILFLALSGCYEDFTDGMNFYFGNLHSHTKNHNVLKPVSVSPAEAFEWARDVAGYDFYAITDHDFEPMQTWKWSQSGVEAENFTQDGSFVALRGFEWSNIISGHISIFNTSKYTSFLLTVTLPGIYSWIDNHDALAQFNHPGELGTHWNFYYFNNVADNMFAIETGNSNKGNNDNVYFDDYIRALDNGWRLAPANNQDNHTLSTNSHRTAVVCSELTEEALLEAMRERRMYSTDDPDMKVVFKYGDEWMGSEIAVPEGPIEFTVAVKDNEPVKKLELITNNGDVIAEQSFGDDALEAAWYPVADSSEGSYFFVRVTSKNILDLDTDEGNGAQIALTAPIWVTVVQ